MNIRSVTLAYLVPPLLASVLGFVGLVQVSEAGIVGASSVVTAAAGAETGSNQRVATALEQVAEAEHATIARMVADRAAPTTRRVALVTDAPSSRGAGWLLDGYEDFTRSMVTTVRPMSELDQFDPTGSYSVFGDDDARRATVRALADAGYEVSVERVPLLQRIGVTDGLDQTLALVGALVSGCVALCLMTTVGAPRRSAVRRLHGDTTAAIVIQELAELRTAVLVTAIGVPVAAIGLWFYNGLASAATLAVAISAFCVGLLVPVVVAHTMGTVVACRQPLVGALRGARPAGALLLVAQIARVPALLVLVAAVFELTGAVTTARQGTAERDLRAAGETVQLWVTPDPRPVEEQAYWDSIGDFAGGALERRDAFLAAAVEVSSGSGKSTVPALVVDQGYLDLQDVRSEDGARITTDGAEIAVWMPADSGLSRERLVEGLTEWQLRDAPAALLEHVTGGTLARQQVYSYPDDASSRAWLEDAVIVVVPTPGDVFSADELGSWLSTGDVVFTSRAAAERSIGASGLRTEFSAVVAVGQSAAEQARHAAMTVAIGTGTLVSTLAVSVMLGMVATIAHRRRHGRAMFAKFTSGVSPVRTDAGLLTIEAGLVSIAVIAVVNTWWSQRPDGSGLRSALDPVVQSAGVAAALALVTLAAVSATSLVVMAVTARRTARNRGNGSR
ncbi:MULTISPECIES: hypothetical protein [Curtobacterium]|uniref:Uncharacterized protein n=1 Tax=Curtobacterium flaccumfaciens pv. flaccumfaciens TaxID=138532 RepID=A0A9Q2W4K8_9MICO|nr:MULTISPECIES: hypothetical protein [Curtobacterium]KQR32941.1 hypothetical protein ASF75_06235 [Curtobacterium sp. Leaf154]MBT1540930.1 hypothetical protein [Curtobacterium flaccumfaciens pv. flaccumfaciens]MCS6564053.1 hypothetical protein [Curtobacterium flaccumfaciens pv. flaccumfaciens]MCS6574510.1 hypothetical protein [Curtobacterium flaccumfaciens pv. flaccumfaciens]MCU0152097.1 hypothetical protein [Curtobacterium flaccumfaciens pv. poinsettiae]